MFHLDLVEQVPVARREPGFADNGAHFECAWMTIEVVNDDVSQLLGQRAPEQTQTIVDLD